MFMGFEGIKKVVISSSMKFKAEIKFVISEFEKLGIVGVFPNVDSYERGSPLTIEEREALAEEHYEAIRNCDAVYFILGDGYMGTSCKVELGYSRALGSLFIFLRRLVMIV